VAEIFEKIKIPFQTLAIIFKTKGNFVNRTSPFFIFFIFLILANFNLSPKKYASHASFFLNFSFAF
jgi:hypothetical protein